MGYVAMEAKARDCSTLCRGADAVAKAPLILLHLTYGLRTYPQIEPSGSVVLLKRLFKGSEWAQMKSAGEDARATAGRETGATY
jgi:hypothetical protein